MKYCKFICAFILATGISLISAVVHAAECPTKFAVSQCKEVANSGCPTGISCGQQGNYTICALREYNSEKGKKLSLPFSNAAYATEKTKGFNMPGIYNKGAYCIYSSYTNENVFVVYLKNKKPDPNSKCWGKAEWSQSGGWRVCPAGSKRKQGSCPLFSPGTCKFV